VEKFQDRGRAFHPEAQPGKLVLASASAARARLLAAAGVDFLIDPANIDEKTLMVPTGNADATALALAGIKALSVAARQPGKLVLGGDSVLDFQGELVGKSLDTSAARALLARLAGQTHRIVSAVVLVKDGTVLWRHVGEGRLTMRPLSEAFLDAYLAAEAPAILAAVGCYHLEGRGAQLFDRIEGDFFSILGLPLLPVLAALREQGVLNA
jgi:septum formation protein